MKFVSYIRRESFVHRLDPRTRLLLCMTLVVLSFVFNHPLFLLGVFLILVGLSFLAKIHGEFLFRVKLLSPLVIMAFILWSLFYRWSMFGHADSSQVMLKVGPLALDKIGILLGAAMPFRVLTMIGAPLLFLMTTTLNELVLALTKLRLPYKTAFTFGLSARLIPYLGNELLTIKEAQTARGLELDRGNLFKRARAYVPVLIPLTFRALEFSDKMGIAMEMKAIGASEKRTFYREIRMGGIDYLVISLIISGLILGIVMRLLGMGVIT